MNIADFYPLIRPLAPTLAFPLLDLAIVNAARDYCQASRCWVELLDAVIADGYSLEYALPLDDQADVVMLQACSIDGADIEVSGSPTQLRALARRRDGSRAAGLTSDMARIVFPTPPVAGARIEVEVSQKPRFGAYSLPDVLRQHVQAIADGALGEVLRTPNQPWTNLAEAGVRMAKFRDECARAGIRASRGGASGSLRVTPNHF